MAEPADDISPGDPERTGAGGWALRIGGLVLLVVAAGLLFAWFSRERIAGNVIDDLLTDYDLPASYDIVSIGPRSQVISDIVIGDPAAPDLVIDRAVIGIDYTLGLPEIGTVRLVRPRLYGTFRDGELSLGALDALIEGGEGAAGLPSLLLELVDGRARIDSDFGPIGIKLEGTGPLDDGFEGIIAANAPGIGSDDCRAGRATFYGAVATQEGAAHVEGPLRLGELQCAGMRIARADIAASADIAAGFDSLEGAFDLVAREIGGDWGDAARLSGGGRFGFSEGVFNLRHDLEAENVDAGSVRLSSLRADGAVRSTDGFARSEWDTELRGGGLAIPALEGETLGAVGAALDGTLLAPLADKLSRNLAVASRGGTIAADLTARLENGAVSLVIPEARLSGTTGEAILAASRVSWSGGALSGNLVTGGEGLPRITGRMEREAGGDLAFRLAMAPYSAGESRLAVPQMSLRRVGEAIAFAGRIEASGPIPSGRIENLRLPLSGTWGTGSGLAIGRRCITARFAALEYADLALDDETLTLCPGEARAMIAYDDRLALSLVAPDPALSGRLGETPMRFAAARAAFSHPGGFAIEDADFVLGAEESAVRMAAATISGDLEEGIGGQFAGGTAALDAVPLDLAALSGRWAYEDGAIRIDRGAFTLTERIEGDARFEPLIARDAVLDLSGGAITASAALREPGSDALVTQVSIRHDLETAEGRALLDVPGLVFGDALAPDDLTYLARGVVADVEGTVTGSGIIEWDGEDVTSRGTFASDGLDLAAAFGPVSGLKGEIEFTDLLGLTTAPGQVLTIDAINPGVEVIGGRVALSLTGGTRVNVEDARWPFMGGTLIMRPVELDYGVAEERAYVFEIVGLEAERFVTEMELANLSASGTFDGTVPIIFDEDGNGRIEGGLLISRPPGGNVAYVGELTYEDMGAIANYAFNALRSLDYNQMAVALEGNLAGEIITRFTFDGVRQGEGASRNFVTRRLSRLPIRFKVNVRSQNFHQLAVMVRSFLDPEYLGNPVDRGLLTTEDGRFVPRDTPEMPADAQPPAGDAIRPDDQPVQLPESEGDL